MHANIGFSTYYSMPTPCFSNAILTRSETKLQHTHNHVQWNLSTTDTLGTEKQFAIQKFPLFRGYFICIAMYLDPQKQSVIERFSLLGEFVNRGSTVCTVHTKIVKHLNTHLSYG